MVGRCRAMVVSVPAAVGEVGSDLIQFYTNDGDLQADVFADGSVIVRMK